MKETLITYWPLFVFIAVLFLCVAYSVSKSGRDNNVLPNEAEEDDDFGLPDTLDDTPVQNQQSTS